MQKFDIEKNDKPILPVLNKTYIIMHKGEEHKWEVFRIEKTKTGRVRYMGTTFRGVLVAITDLTQILSETDPDPNFYSEFRAAGVEKCIGCGGLRTANDKFFPGTYNDEETIAPPICESCLQMEFKDPNTSKERKEVISKARFSRLSRIHRSMPY